jgi:hypothetical protein
MHQQEAVPNFDPRSTSPSIANALTALDKVSRCGQMLSDWFIIVA